MTKPKKSDHILNSQVEELTADLKRIHADFINFRRRSEEQRGEIVELVKQDVILQVLPLLDNISRALEHMPKDLQKHSWAAGVAKVAKQSQQTLAQLGIERIKALGEIFDPNIHEAIGGEGEKVIQELQPGYKLGSKIIRPAIVKVGKE